MQKDVEPMMKMSSPRTMTRNTQRLGSWFPDSKTGQ
jgi:hypothetical protein